MPVEFQCACGKRLRANSDAAGSQGQCPACGRPLEIPPIPSGPASESFVRGADTFKPLPRYPSPEPAEAAPEPEASTDLVGAAELLPPPPPYRLASPGQIGLATF